MKLITVRVDDSVDIQQWPVGSSIALNPTVTGMVMALSVVENPAPPQPELVPHTHPVAGVTGAPVP